MSDMAATIEELRNAAAAIYDVANWLTGAFSGEPEAEASAAPAKEPETVLAFENVRAILADKSHEGFTAQIRELLQKYGTSKLSEVDASARGWIAMTQPLFLLYACCRFLSLWPALHLPPFMFLN